jgi:hypothetical protein
MEKMEAMKSIFKKILASRVDHETELIKTKTEILDRMNELDAVNP